MNAIDARLPTDKLEFYFRSSANMGIEEAIAFGLAMRTRSRVVASAEERLRHMTEHLQSGDDSGLENIWEEICVQVQGEESAMFSSYEDTIETCIAEEVSALEAFEQIALWLCTDQGCEWRSDAQDNHRAPIRIADIAADLKSDVLSDAGDFENERIYNFRFGLSSDEGEDENKLDNQLVESECREIQREPIGDVMALNPQDAIRILTGDFGVEFVDMIRVVAEKSALDALQKLLAENAAQ